jgi:hypothetical protein
MSRWLLLLVLAGALATGCARLGGEPQQPSHNAALQVTAERTVGQTFEVRGSGVAGVDLLVATFSQPADPSGTLEVVLRDAVGGAEVAVAEVPGGDLADNSWVAVRFDGAQEVGGRPAVEVRWDGASPVALRANVPPDPLPPDVLVNDPYPFGELVLDGELAAGDLAFRVVGADGLAAAPRTARGLVGGLLRGLAGTPAFAVLWLVLLSGCAALAVVGLRRGRRDA